MATQDLLREQQFSGLARADATHECHLRARTQFGRICERNVDWGLSWVTRIVIAGDYQVTFDQFAKGRYRVQPLKEWPVNLPSIEDDGT